MTYDFDLFVIGGGSGGVRAARLAAQAGQNVGMAEGDRMGGTCVIRGCVPKKLMLFASDAPTAMDTARGLGWNIEDAGFDWQKFRDALQAELNRLENIYAGIMEKNKVRLFHDFAQLDGPNHVVLNNGMRLSAERILIATGGRPFVPEISGREWVMTSDDVFSMPELPESIAIIGGGYIASEFAGIFHGMGVQVHQIYRGDLILRGYDQELREKLVKRMTLRGIDLRQNLDVQAITERDGKRVLVLSDGTELVVDQVLYATGRRANTENLGLENADIETLRDGAIPVNEQSQTRQDSIYAIGDVTGRAALTPVAIREAVNFVETVYNNNPRQVNYDMIPTAIFTRPEIGTIGMGEDAAKENGFDIDVYATDFQPMRSGFSGQEDRMFMKLVIDQKTDRVLGAHIMGEGAGEMIQIAAIPITMGATKAQFDATIAVHPTSAEELVTMNTPRNA